MNNGRYWQVVTSSGLIVLMKLRLEQQKISAHKVRMKSLGEIEPMTVLNQRKNSFQFKRSRIQRFSPHCIFSGEKSFIVLTS